LTRKLNETIIINGDIRITVVGLRGHQVRLGIEAPESVAIFREELYDRDYTGHGRQKVSSAGAATAPVTR